MRQLITAIIFIMMPLCSVMADGYGYLTFTNSDGTVKSVASGNLEITFSDGKLIATNGTENVSISLASISKMAFTQETTAIQQVADGGDIGVDVFTTAGVLAGHYDSIDAARQQLTSGLYIMKTESQTFKVTIR